jgi:hypothetical protein
MLMNDIGELIKNKNIKTPYTIVSEGVSENVPDYGSNSCFPPGIIS